jgi:hypothetical protein
VSALAESGLRGTVLAPEGLGVRLPAWTSRLHPLCGLSTIRENDTGLLARCAAFHEARAIGPEQVGLLRDGNVRYVIAETSSPLHTTLAAQPLAFPVVVRGDELVLYEWRAERWRGE